MSDDSSHVFGSMDAYFIVVNKIKVHYLAARSLLEGDLNRPEARFWIFSKVLDACSECIENLVDRLARERGIKPRDGERKGEFQTRVCAEAGLTIGHKTLAHLKDLMAFWNEHKHSGDGEAWRRGANRSTARFAIDSFHITTALVAAYYRLLGKREQPEWIRRAEVEKGIIALLPLEGAEIDRLLADWEIALSP